MMEQGELEASPDVQILADDDIHSDDQMADWYQLIKLTIIMKFQ